MEPECSLISSKELATYPDPELGQTSLHAS